MNDVAERAFRPHHEHVYRYVRRRTHDHHHAEDLTQQVFTEAVAGLGESSSSPPPAWLYTVAQRRFADEARRDTIARRLSGLRLVEQESQDYGAPISPQRCGRRSTGWRPASGKWWS